MRGSEHQKLAIRLGICQLLLLATVSLSGCQKQSSNEAFHRGRDLLSKGRFDEAESRLVEFEKSNPNGSLSSRARFLRAKSRMGAGDLAAARLRFQETIDLFPNSEEAMKAKFKIAMISFIEGDLPTAQASFQRIVDRADSIYVPEAKAMLEMLRQQQSE